MTESRRQPGPARAPRSPTAPGGAGRVISGAARGRRLAAPGAGTRPLGDRVKQSLFAILEPEVRDRSFLDVFAGSGAGGIEALSRGAADAVFVEQHVAALQTIERNLRTASLLGLRARLVKGDAIAWLAEPEAARGFAAILVDPPYDRPELLERALERIGGRGPGSVLASDGVVVAKHFQKAPPSAEFGLLRSGRALRFGDTTLTFYRWVAAPEGQEDR
ncbi:MAG TPA: 16S rRNA (guanine(966)-N(2))-methyltransferase RsmD [Candidatus Limnocylindria bacterium]|nr:16S rRNA (guanine(966)-N(2))-methyltransferase RsmD [Candidatus Limnocylindria bacterium]